MTQVQTCLGPRDPDELGTTLIHEHVFVRSPELDLNLPDPEWVEAEAVERAVSGFHRLHDLGVRTVLGLTVSSCCAWGTSTGWCCRTTRRSTAG
ncbi:MAG TPA: hypothetical protein VFR87_09795 [Nocardioidaceae bacterium]|nr:hypothetical protein [Nocardioidaceae bacterium]